jgi:hypothetical protein
MGALSQLTQPYRVRFEKEFEARMKRDALVEGDRKPNLSRLVRKIIRQHYRKTRTRI